MLVCWLAEREYGAKCVKVSRRKEKSLVMWLEDPYGHTKPGAMKGCGLFFQSDVGQAVSCWPSMFTAALWNRLVAKDADSGLRWT